MTPSNIIAIIDDGIQDDIFDPSKIKFNIEINESLVVIPHVNKGTFNHSAECAVIINEYAPGADFASIKVLNKDAKGLISQLIKAIEWCIENQVAIINLSLGTTTYLDFERLKVTVNKAYKAGCIIIAACHNSNIVTYPAFLENVIGVKCDQSNTLKKCEFIYVENPLDGIDIIAPGYTIPVTEGDYVTNSFAAPRITALVFKMLSKNPGMSFIEIKKELWKQSTTTDLNKKNCINVKRRIDWAENCLLIAIGHHKTPFENTGHLKIIREKVLINMDEFSDEVLQNLSHKIKYCSDTIETVILFTDRDLNIKPGDEKNLLDCIFQSNKNLIYLNDRCSLGDLPVSGFTHKVWSPFYQIKYAGNNIHNTERKKSNEIPIILINNFTGSEQLAELSELIKSINEEGYYALALSEFSSGILFGFEYLPQLDDYFTYIKEIIRSFAPELLVIIADCNSRSVDYTQILKDDLKADITINILKSYDEILNGDKNYGKNTANVFTEELYTQSALCRNESFLISNIKGIQQYLITTLNPEMELTSR